MRPRRPHHLAVGPELDPEHPVRGRVLRTHVEDHLVGVDVLLRPVVDGSRGHQDWVVCALGGVKSKGPTPIFSPPMARSAIWGVGFTCMPL